MLAGLEAVAPAFSWSPPYHHTLGEEVADLATLAGFAPDPEQRLALDMLFGELKSGRPSAFEFAVVCSRQNLKTGLFKQAALGWLFITEQRLVVWSAHEFSTAQEAFRDMTVLIESTPDLEREVKAIHRGNGEEAIELLGDRRLMFKARTKGGGRGLTGDKIVLDEAFALHPVHMGALLPTLSSRPDAQVVYGSSAGLSQSDVLRSIRDRGRALDDPRMAYLEWCDPNPGTCGTPQCTHSLDAIGCALDDRERWRAANPALGRRIDEDYIAAERRALPPDEFARERLGWWDSPDDTVTRVISAEAWKSCQDRTSQIVGDYTLAIDVAPNRSWSAVTAAGLTEAGLVHIEVTSRGDLIDHRPGTDWVVPRLVQLGARKVAMDAGSAAGSLVQDIEKAGIEVVSLTNREVGQACGAFFDLVKDVRLTHLGQPEFDTALANAAKRDIGDGAWAWSRRKSSIDITPLYAATLAAWVQAGRREFAPSILFI